MLNGFNDQIGSLAGSGKVMNYVQAATLTVGADNTSTTFSGIIQNTLDGYAGTYPVSLTKVGSGTLTLSGANTYTGATTIDAGTLKLGAASRIADTSALTVSSGATFDLGGYSETVGSIAGAGTITSSATGTLTLTAGGDNTSTTFSGLIQNGTATSIALTKTGTGTLTLSGDNTYTGLTTISDGTLKLGAAGGSTNTPLGTTAAGTTVSSNGTLDLGGYTLGTAEALTLNGTGRSSIGALMNSGSAATYSGLITLGSASSIVGGTGTITISNVGTITGATYGLTLGGAQGGTLTSILGTTTGTLTKQDAGTWTLSGANTYTGDTTISAGTLAISNATALGTSAGVTSITTGAALNISGGITVAEPITINGTGVSSDGAIKFTSGNNTYSGAITLGSDSTLTSTSGNQTISGTVNGAYALTVSAAGNWTHSGIIGGTTQLTGLSITANSYAIYSNKDVSVNGPITFTAANIYLDNAAATVIRSYLLNADIKFLATNDITSSSKTSLLTITSNGGNILLSSNTDATSYGRIQIWNGLTINSNGGNITLAGGDLTGSGSAKGNLTTDGAGYYAYNEGVRVDNGLNLTSSNGNIIIRGETPVAALPDGYGGAGVGFYYGDATINSGTGTIYISGRSSTYGSNYSSGFVFHQGTLTISSASTSANAIQIYGTNTTATANGENFGIELNASGTGATYIYATGSGGGITINTSAPANYYDVVARSTTYIFAKDGPIQLLGNTTGGYLYFGTANNYIGSKASSGVNSNLSSSNITIQYDTLSWASGVSPYIATTGTFTWQPYSASFVQAAGYAVYTSWWNLNQNSQTVTGITIGKANSTHTVYINEALTANGPITVYGANIYARTNVTASGTGDINLIASTLFSNDSGVRRTISTSSGDITS